MTMIPAQRRITESSATVARQPFHHSDGATAPGPKGRRLLGSLLDVRSDLLKFVIKATAHYGALVNFRMGPRNVFLISDPSYAHHVLQVNQSNYHKGLGLREAKHLLGEGLLTSEGKLWASQRHFLQAAFHGKKLEEYCSVMAGETESLISRWRSSEATEQCVDVADEMVRLTLNILGATLFGQNFRAVADDIALHLNTLTNWAVKRMTSLWRLPLDVPTPHNRRAAHALRSLDEIVRQMFSHYRQQDASQRGHLLSLLLDTARAREGVISQKQARDEVMTFLLAGHETTAATLTWTLFLLSQHPEAQRRLYLEVEATLAGRAPGWEDVPRLGYARMVINEAMRLYPPVWLLPRKAIEEDRIGGYAIPPRADVLISVYSLHRHPAYWEDPESFIPERFASGDSAQRSACAYIPFGAGQRTCPGNRFGMMETILALALLVRHYRFESLPEQQVTPVATLSLRPSQGLKLRLVKRV